jgi:hypothetical protein
MAGHALVRDRAVYISPVANMVDTDGDTIAESGDATVAALKETLRKHGIPIVAYPRPDSYTLNAKLTH